MKMVSVLLKITGEIHARSHDFRGQIRSQSELCVDAPATVMCASGGAAARLSGQNDFSHIGNGGVQQRKHSPVEI
jgi:hypothetical protein